MDKQLLARLTIAVPLLFKGPLDYRRSHVFNPFYFYQMYFECTASWSFLWKTLTSFISYLTSLMLRIMLFHVEVSD